MKSLLESREGLLNLSVKSMLLHTALTENKALQKWQYQVSISPFRVMSTAALLYDEGRKDGRLSVG